MKYCKLGLLFKKDELLMKIVGRKEEVEKVVEFIEGEFKATEKEKWFKNETNKKSN